MLVETLENRKMFAVTADAFHSTLYVWGDNNGNGISVEKSGSNLVVKEYKGSGIGYQPIFTVSESSVDQIRMYGYNGADTMTVNDNVTHKVTIYGGKGGDYLKGGGGDSFVWGHGDWAGDPDHGPASDDSAADILVASKGYSRLYGQKGNDSFYSSDVSGSNYAIMYGSSGNDKFYTSDGVGTSNAVYIFGESGNDIWTPAANKASRIVAFDGGSGSDRADYSAWTSSVYAKLDNYSYSGLRYGDRKHAIRDNVERVDGGSGNDYFVGNNYNNIFVGNNGNDVMYGSGGNDLLIGNDGNDSLYGEAGNDTLIGGAGSDLLSGGSGTNSLTY